MNVMKLVAGPYAAIRLSQRLKPAGGDGSKIYPPTFEGGVYVFEQRRFGDRTIPCVLLDSVASSANRQEESLAELVARGVIKLPHFVSDFSELPELGEVSTLNAPHRVFDAIFRDSELDGKPFPKHPISNELSRANTKNATALFKHAPTALLFGAWDSTGSLGGLGNKFARAIVTEIIGVNVERGETRGGVRQDPLAISRDVEIEVDKNKNWKPKGVVDDSKKERGKGTRPSEVNHGNILVTVEYEQHGDRRVAKKGGVTCEYAIQQSVISLTGLRRLRFPIGEDKMLKSAPEIDDAGRAVLAALGLVALTSTRDRGYALRSRCDLVADGLAPFEVLRHDGSTETLELSTGAAIEIFQEAVQAARKLGLPWEEEPIVMKPQAKLLELVRLSREAGAE